MERNWSNLSLQLGSEVMLRRACSAPLLPTLAPNGNHQYPSVPPNVRQSRSGGRYINRGFRFVLIVLVMLMTMQIGSFLVTRRRSNTMPKVAWAEMERNLSADEIPLARSYETGADSLFVPLRIPRIIHHLYDGTLMEDQDAMLSYQHWQRANPGWELRFYDVADMRYYVERWLPEYVATFDALPFDSGKRDFFGYLTILHHGGIFAHASAKCPQPLNRVLQSWDAMVVVWDREWSTAEAALERCYVRRKQLQHRVFAAVPGHPLLKAIVEQVSSSWTSSSKAEGPFDDDVLEWMERVGAGLFTRLALDYASGNPPSKDRRAWSLRILPREMLGAPLVQNCLVDPVSGSLNEYLDETVDGDDTTANHSDAHRAWAIHRSRHLRVTLESYCHSYPTKLPMKLVRHCDDCWLRDPLP